MHSELSASRFAPCRVATQGLPAFSRRFASGSYRVGLRAPRTIHCPPPLRAQLPRRASRVATLQAGARSSSPIPPRSFCGQWLSRPLANNALRASVAASHLDSRRILLRLTPSPCSRRRAPARSISPLGGVFILHPSSHSTTTPPHLLPHTSGYEWLATLAARIEQGLSPALPTIKKLTRRKPSH